MSDFSVLLLAWDDADPSVAVLGHAALPPTLPLVYRLATQQPVLAVYPHLPAAAAELPPSIQAAAAQVSDAAPNALTVATPVPGVHLLPATTSAAQSSSRIIGLSELPAASVAQLTADFQAEKALPAIQAAVLARSQWPTGPGGGTPTRPQAPAAPYLGASVDVASAAQAEPAPASISASPATRHAAAGQLTATPTPASSEAAELPAAAPEPDAAAVAQPALFSEAIAEPGPAETAAVLAADDTISALDEFMAELELTANEPAAFAEAPALSSSAEPDYTSPLQPGFDNLNFRMIQYARRAAQLVRHHTDFGIIYAPNWPAWLAALELRNSTGKPLVLYATGLAADFVSPAERGWLLEVERMALRRAHLILVPDEGVRQRLAGYYGSNIGEVRVVAPHDEAAVQQVLGAMARV
ncbi:glycosyltransferase family 4 protein [Hymenobacter glacialis]|uniref:glycosyltransferase family 4 protein n=1 Tax=Hymenobacter glacialis TaxID=1908236 RepID=UPI001300CA96|nr:glycosyltransferase family 4 protein [Hymenobacter glacialis]